MSAATAGCVLLARMARAAALHYLPCGAAGCLLRCQPAAQSCSHAAQQPSWLGSRLTHTAQRGACRLTLPVRSVFPSAQSTPSFLPASQQSGVHSPKQVRRRAAVGQLQVPARPPNATLHWAGTSRCPAQCRPASNNQPASAALASVAEDVLELIHILHTPLLSGELCIG